LQLRGPKWHLETSSRATSVFNSCYYSFHHIPSIFHSSKQFRSNFHYSYTSFHLFSPILGAFTLKFTIHPITSPPLFTNLNTSIQFPVLTIISPITFIRLLSPFTIQPTILSSHLHHFSLIQTPHPKFHYSFYHILTTFHSSKHLQFSLFTHYSFHLLSPRFSKRL
jgi:hypothetical protein